MTKALFSADKVVTFVGAGGRAADYCPKKWVRGRPRENQLRFGAEGHEMRRSKEQGGGCLAVTVGTVAQS